ncbi:DNA-binding transcriptional regulator DsdC [Desulfocurvus sp. DL9XJH121]
MDKQTLAQSLGSLHTFFCAGRHMSFSKAADELCLTPGAVSHRIRNLEEALGFPLFHRFTRRIDFTAQGAMLFSVLDNSLGEITTQLRNINNQTLNGQLRITSPPSFASVWIMDRLHDFRRRFPGICIDLQNRNDLVDFESEPVDLAIYYGPGVHPGLHVTHLMEEFMSPVCSPAYADAHGLWGDTRKLRDCTFLHDDAPVPSAPRHSEWSNWAMAAGVENLPFDRCYSFDRSELALRAAIQGIGVAMGRSELIRDALYRGDLVQPFPLRALSAYAYYAVIRQEDAGAPRISALMNWLKEQVQQSAKAGAGRLRRLDDSVHAPAPTPGPVQRLVAEYCIGAPETDSRPRRNKK